MFVLLYAFVILLNSTIAFKLEPSCSSFHYEEQTLEKLIRLQIYVEKMKEELDATQLKAREEINTLSKEREQFQKEIHDIKDDLTATKMQHVNAIKQFADDVLKIKESTSVPPVAFQSHKVGDRSMADNKVIIFTTDMINYEDSYNNQTGIFTVPVDGIYMLSAQLYLPSKRHSYYGIYVNEAFVQHGLIGDQDYGNVYTLVAVADVAEGDRVTVRCISSCGGDSLYEHTYSTSSFAGVLIHGK